MYYTYIRVVILGALSRHSSVWTRSHSYGLCQILHICSHLYKRFTCKTLNRLPHLSGPRRYFFHHSNRVLSLQYYPSLAGKTGGTRIDKYRTLIMPLVRKCKEQHALAHLYNRLARRLFARRRCGSCSVFEAAHTVYKYAPNTFSFRVWVSHPIESTKPTILRNCGRNFCP